MIYIGDEISIEWGLSSKNTLVLYDEEPVGGIQEISFNASADGCQGKCVLLPLEKSLSLQQKFAAELVKHTFSIIWNEPFGTSYGQWGSSGTKVWTNWAGNSNDEFKLQNMTGLITNSDIRYTA